MAQYLIPALYAWCISHDHYCVPQGHGAKRKKKKKSARVTCVGARASLTAGGASVDEATLIDETTVIARIDAHGREDGYVQLAATPGLWRVTLTSGGVALSAAPVAVHVASSTRIELHVSHVSHEAEPAEEADGVVHIFSLASGALLLRSYILYDLPTPPVSYSMPPVSYIMPQVSYIIHTENVGRAQVRCTSGSYAL